MSRVAIVTSHPIQYQAPWFRALAHRTEIEVLFCHRQSAADQAAAGFDHAFEWDVPLLDGYRSRWLRNVSRQPGVEAFGGCDTPEIADVLAQGRFDACLVNGWYLKSYLQAIRACWGLRIPVLVRGDSHLRGPRSRVKSAAKYLPYRWFLPRIDAHLYVGRANRAYLEHYGVREDRLFFTPHFVDNDRFAASAAGARASGEVERLKAEWSGHGECTVFMFAGKLIDKKRPADLLLALSGLRARGRRVAGVVVGSGPLESELRALAAGHRVPVSFAGFRNQTQIPACYAAADCLVLPSDGRETWGLVVNEAMACGTPAVVSDTVGCAADLIEEGQTGFSYPLGDVPALMQRLTEMADRLTSAPERVERAVANVINRYTCRAAVAGTLEALACVQEGRRAGVAHG